MNSKKCTRCLILQPISNFSKASREKDGLQYRCKSCNSIMAAEYRANNQEKEKFRHAKYQKENPEKEREKQRRWHANNPEKSREKARRFYENNKDKERERMKRWRDANPEWRANYAKKYRKENTKRFREYEDKYWRENLSKSRAKSAKRRAQRIQATPIWANENKILAIYEKCIKLSKETGIEHHIDHIVPLVSKAVCGLHVDYNLQILTASENLRKNNKFNSG